MTSRRTTPKSSTASRSWARKRQDHRRHTTPTLQDDVASDENDDGYNSSDVVPSDESPNDSEFSDQPRNDDASFADSDYSQTDPPLSSACAAAPSSLPYVHIAPFPIFRGGSEECPDAHLSRFAKVCRANNASSADAMARIFPVTLEGEASLWYDLNIEPYEKLTWEDIKSSFSEAFGPAESSAEILRSELVAIRQGDDESVRSYFLRLQWMMRRILPGHGLSDEMLREIFVGGLRGEFRDGVAARRPGSLSEALRLALRVGGNVAAKKCWFCGGTHEEKGCAARELWMRSGSGAGGESKGEIRRSVSIAAGTTAGEGDGNKKKGQSQCQCWKHQCWKRNGIERNSSFKPL